MLPEKCAVARCTPSNKKTSCRAVAAPADFCFVCGAPIAYNCRNCRPVPDEESREKKLLRQREPHHG